MEWRYLIKQMALPPSINLLLIVAGLMLWRRHRQTARVLLLLGVGTLYLFSTPWFAGCFQGTLERYPAIPVHSLSQEKQTVGAIVILGGGRYLGGNEFGSPMPGRYTMERLDYGAFLHRKTGVPLLVSGGKVFDDGPGDGELMAHWLQQQAGIRVEWIEGRSRTTAENAFESYRLLQPLLGDAPRIYLVTHGWHMPRSVAIFRQAGFDVIPAPTRLKDGYGQVPWALGWVPNGSALSRSSAMFHEWLGRLWYWIRY